MAGVSQPMEGIFRQKNKFKIDYFGNHGYIIGFTPLQDQ